MARRTFWASGSSGSTDIMAEMPWGTVAVGTTMTSFSDRPTHCWAAMTMFLLLGRTNTTSLGVWSISRRMASVEGFMV